jgi:hypothetical protein
MNREKYDALEYCLQALEDGADLQAVLGRYPELAEELKPLLVAAAQARSLAAPEAPPETVRLGRQRLQRRAVELRARRRVSIMPRLQRFGFSMALALILLLSGTGLVQASSSTLPGDRLYPVKRTWEDMRLFLVFKPGYREALEGHYDQERLREVSLVLEKGRIVPITFTGLITSQRPGEIVVSGVPVAISDQTQFSGTQAIEGAAVIVSGLTDLQGLVLAGTVQVLPPGSVVPLGGQWGHQLPGGLDEPQPGEVTPLPAAPQAQSGETHDEPDSFHVEGSILSIQEGFLVVDGRTVYLNGAKAPERLAPGMWVEIVGYFAEDGRFVATEIEIEDDSSDEGEGQDSDESDGDDELENDSSGEDGSGEDAQDGKPEGESEDPSEAEPDQESSDD